MAKARKKIKLGDLGIAYLRPKLAATGAMLLEVPGDGSAAKADLLAAKLREALAATGARVARPVKTEELRVTGLDDSITKEEIAAAIAAAGSCSAPDVRVGDIRRGPSGLGTVWLQCPTAAAKKVAAAGRLTVGWVSARVEALTPRPMRCHRCLELGHTRSRCTAPTDRGNRCYRCGAPGHTAGRCAGEVKCPLCSDLDRPAGHRLGAKACAPQKKGMKKTGGAGAIAPSPALEAAPAYPPSEASTVDMEVEEEPGLHMEALLAKAKRELERRMGDAAAMGEPLAPPSANEEALEEAIMDTAH